MLGRFQDKEQMKSKEGLKDKEKGSAEPSLYSKS
jgi:hypothetical protein